MKILALAACFVALAAPAYAARWVVTKSEQDPFDKSKMTLVMQSNESGRLLALRCLESKITFAMSLGAGDVYEGDEIGVRLVVDDKEPISADGMLLNANNFSSIIQFGDEETTDYLRGAKRFWVRVTAHDTSATTAFTGGSSFEDAIKKVRHACGIEDPAPPPAAPTVAPKLAAAIARGPTKDCMRETSCARQFACLSTQGQLGDSPDAEGYSSWCQGQPGMKP